MKIRFFLCVLVPLFSTHLRAAQSDKPYHGSPEFELVKSLVGNWKGKADMGQGPVEVSLEYHLISAGSAVEERLFVGTPKEMVTIYHDKQGKLALAHYCMLANQPVMVLKSSESGVLKFDLDPSCGIKVDSELHMHALILRIKDPNTITQEWELYEKGQSRDAHGFTFKRVKSRA